VRARRDNLTGDERRIASSAIAQRAAAEVPPGIVALYAAKGTEVSTTELDALLRARGNTIVYPRIVEGSRVLVFAVGHPGEMVASALGIPEPHEDAPVVSLADIAAFVIPGLAFDRNGGRLGWGRGHYDTSMSGTTAKRIGLAFECQILDDIPREAHDLPLDTIVTEVAIYQIAK
jgi:5-formyltetrahydrofolate cyclo-ligase